MSDGVQGVLILLGWVFFLVFLQVWGMLGLEGVHSVLKRAHLYLPQGNCMLGESSIFSMKKVVVKN